MASLMPMGGHRKGLANTNQLITKTEDEFFDELNVSDDVKNRLRELIDTGYIKLPEMEVYAFDKFQMLNKTNSLQTLDDFEAVAKTGRIAKTTQFFANIVTCYQQRQDMGESAKNAQDSPFFAPNPDDILQQMKSMPEYQLEISNGQRKTSKIVERQCDNAQVFIGSLNREAFEPDLMSMLSMVPNSTVHELRIMMGYDGRSRGFAFVVFEEADGGARCKEILNEFEFMGKKLHVNVSKPIKRLFVGSLLRDKTKEDYWEEFMKNGVHSITDIIMHEPVDVQKAAGQVNRGFCFIDFESHIAAAEVKKNLLKRTLLLFGRYTGIVDWADPVNDPSEETMSKVKILYAKGWKPDRTENEIKSLFSEFGTIEKVKKIHNFSFIHFADRESALTAMRHYDGQEINSGEHITVTLAKPDCPNAKLKKMQKYQQRNQGQAQQMQYMSYAINPQYTPRQQAQFMQAQAQMINQSKTIGKPNKQYMMNAPYMNAMAQAGFMQNQFKAGNKRGYKDQTVTSVKKKKH